MKVISWSIARRHERAWKLFARPNTVGAPVGLASGREPTSELLSHSTILKINCVVLTDERSTFRYVN